MSDKIEGNNMKKLILVVAFIAVLGIVTVVGTKMLHSEQNQQYIERILREDISVQTKLGEIRKYKISKVGRFAGSPNEQSNDYYILNVTGEKSFAVVKIKLYKNNNGEIERYKISMEE